MRDSTSARSRVSWWVGCGHAARVNLGFRASLEALLLLMALRLSHRFVAIGLFPPSSDSWHPTHSTHKFTRATAWGRAFSRTLVGHEFVVASEELPVQCWHHLGVLFVSHALIHMIAILMSSGSPT